MLNTNQLPYNIQDIHRAEDMMMWVTTYEFDRYRLLTSDQQIVVAHHVAHGESFDKAMHRVR